MQRYGNLALNDFTLDFSTHLPFQCPSQRHRRCSNLRSIWIFTCSAYDLQVSDTTVCARRGCMIIVLVERTLLALLNVLADATRAKTVAAGLGLVSAVVSFFHIAWCLAVIEGLKDRCLSSTTPLKRAHFDVFLWLLGVVHLVLLLFFFRGFEGAKLSFMLLLTWLFIFMATWLAGQSRTCRSTDRQTEDPSCVV
ncbi:hypothetical protein D0861_08043 [Hortaea werneckii]|uniref:Uncharacterized protein n=1 Tax=Hortaea werneckii TaxID=91943 RepID=A0A3M7EZK7_HORWE|nr:hypothetical protein D0861_08043 [Hortaea werneckii]